MASCQCRGQTELAAGCTKYSIEFPSTHSRCGCICLYLLAYVVEVDGEELLDELVVGVAEVGFVVVELQVLFQNHLLNGRRNWTRML